MARLEGVKVFDAKEGLIEKLKYNGDIYVRTKDLPKYGDIALVVKPWGNQIEGEYYLVINEDHGLYELAKKRNKEKEHVFIEGEAMNASTDLHKVEIFRKIESVQAGDLIEMLEDDEAFGYEVSDRFPVFKNYEGDLYIVDKDEDKRFLAMDYRHKVVGKSEVEKNGIKYKYVNRKAQRGDMIIPLETSSRYFTNGKLYGPVNGYLMVIDDYGDSLSAYSKGDNRTEDNVLVYEPVIEKKSVGYRSNSMSVETEYKVGDLVEITEEGSHEFEIGEVVRLNKVGDPTGQPYRAEYLSGKDPDCPWLYGHEFKRFDGTLGEDDASLEDETEASTYKIGDIVVVTVEFGGSTLYEGDIGIISEDHVISGMFRVSVPGKENAGNIKEECNIRHATSEERKQFAINLVKEGAFA